MGIQPNPALARLCYFPFEMHVDRVHISGIPNKPGLSRGHGVSCFSPQPFSGTLSTQWKKCSRLKNALPDSRAGAGA